MSCSRHFFITAFAAYPQVQSGKNFTTPLFLFLTALSLY
jgi:hypothetical protein